MNWSTDAFLNRLYKEAEQERLLASKGDRALSVYREALRQQVLQALGKFPAVRCPLNPELLDSRDYGDYVLERVQYTTMESVTVPVLVLIPKQGNGPWPAVVACHGHSTGQHEAVGMAYDGSFMDDPGIHNRFAVELVRRGMLVAFPEIMGFGARRQSELLLANPEGGGPTSCGTLASHLLAYGRTLAGMRIYEALRCVDYLQSRDDVDGGKIGAFGFSGGGLISSFAAGLDERIRATVLCGYTNTFKGSILGMHHCIDNYIPGLLLYTEQPELIGLIAPRDLFVESGEQDPIFPVSHARAAIQELQSLYASLNAADRFGSDIFPGGHEISGRASFDRLVDRLGGFGKKTSKKTA
ncbi:alpha/beta hydrolase family protein [Paenibacillus rigui]|uniref:Dienelactone hydrolase n=1 Tax=Paenibacillus rigui TaxID=554312 RepID=A0A229UPB5_9BACL|nr:alpha/beta hydrolase family protein [Paenibacillus rigui]OXM85397.1 dienelactone hydrolase [Paenibacillus rigui]